MTGRALLVSADDWLRTSLEVALTTDDGPLAEVTAAASAQAALDQVGGHDLVLFDANGADMPAGSWCAAVSAGSDAPILVLHDQPEVGLLTGCLEAGATGFQTKSITVGELGAAIEAVQRGEAVVPRRMLGGLLGTLIQRRRRDDEAAARYDRLTKRERQILGLIADGADRESIAGALFISPQTARTHIQNLLGKLEVHSRLEAADFAHEHGYAESTQERAR